MNARRAERRLKRDRRRDCRFDEGVMDSFTDGQLSPPAQAERAELTNRIDRAMGRMPSNEQRSALILYYFAGWTQAEIGARLGLHRTTVTKLIVKGQRQLLKCGLLSSDDLH